MRNLYICIFSPITGHDVHAVHNVYTISPPPPPCLVLQVFVSTMAYTQRVNEMVGERTVYALLVDEAGVVPEMKLASLLSVNSYRILFIGDQNQVSVW